MNKPTETPSKIGTVEQLHRVMDLLVDGSDTDTVLADMTALTASLIVMVTDPLSDDQSDREQIAEHVLADVHEAVLLTLRSPEARRAISEVVSAMFEPARHPGVH